MQNLKTKLYVGAAGTTAAVTGLTTLAGAQAVDPTNGAFDSGVADITSFITGVGAPALFGLAAVAVGIKVGLKYFRRAGASV